ncbi:MAG: hypothetical protein K6G44_04855 [Lentisphaeria bacterium]|nr:hypothetical protein [Lentisphaeria bacterium]
MKYHAPPFLILKERRFYMLLSPTPFTLRASLPLHWIWDYTYSQANASEDNPFPAQRHGLPWLCINNRAQKSAIKPHSGERNLAVGEVRKAHVTHGKTGKYE